MTNAKAIHQLLVDKANELDLPKAYHKDLDYHDLVTLKEVKDDQVLLWGIGEMGTYMLKLKPKESPSYWIYAVKGVDYWFLIKDGKLEEVK